MNVRDLAQVTFFGLVIKPFMALFIGLRVRGRENLPQHDPFVMVANHSSHLDTLSMLNLFPLRRLSRLRPVAAADYFERNRLVSFLSRAFFNILPISRKCLTAESNPLPRMLATLEAGQSLIIFPEGTRGAGEIGHFHSGVAHLIEKMPELTVVPVYLANMGRSLPKGEWLPVPFFCEVRIGEARQLHGSRQEITHALEAAVRQLKDSP